MLKKQLFLLLSSLLASCVVHNFPFGEIFLDKILNLQIFKIMNIVVCKIIFGDNNFFAQLSF